MTTPEITRLLACMEDLKEALSPKATLDQVILYLMVCQREEYPLAELGEHMDWSTLRTSRQVNTMADQKYGGGQYEQGYEVLYTQEDPENRVFKNAYLSHKGEELKKQLIGHLALKKQKAR